MLDIFKVRYLHERLLVAISLRLAEAQFTMLQMPTNQQVFCLGEQTAVVLAAEDFSD